MIEEFERIERCRANQWSVTNAYGWAAIISGFRAEGAPVINPIDLLPFPEEIDQGDRRISRETAAVLVALDRNPAFPNSAKAMLGELIDEAKKLEGY